MIVDIPTTSDSTMQSGNPLPCENPPAYESAVGGGSIAPLSGKNASPQHTQPKGPPLMLAGGPQAVYGATSSESTVYYYQDPRTGQRVASLLPPDHPEMVCLQTGTHIPDTRYGCLGVLAAIIWFPLGIALCLLDRRVRCERCGMTLEDGLCS